MAKKGRPRKAGKRHPGGKLVQGQRRDGGTVEAAERRAWLAGRDNSGRQRDVARSAYPLGVLLVNGSIDENEHDAACRLAWLFARVHGRVSVGAVRYEAGREARRSAADASEDPRLPQWQTELNAALTALRQASRACLDDMLNLAVYERWPGFMRPGFPTTRDVRHAERIRTGLNTLLRSSGRGKHAA